LAKLGTSEIPGWGLRTRGTVGWDEDGWKDTNVAPSLHRPVAIASSYRVALNLWDMLARDNRWRVLWVWAGFDRCGHKALMKWDLLGYFQPIQCYLASRGHRKQVAA
jgi:hypothetical protein